MSLSMRRRAIQIFTLLCCVIAVLCLPARAQTQDKPPAKPFTAGQMVESVSCASDPTETYALYLPSTYDPAKSWPIIYAFDPAARGKLPVQLYKDVAEKFGYILAASNNSRNFQVQEAGKAAQAVWNDTHARLNLDARRIYMMGFSGGARVATQLAMNRDGCAVAGVIAHGASDSFSSAEKARFAYVAIAGDRDFNWPEVIALRHMKEDCCAAFQVKVFAGEHDWAPASVVEEAVQWLHLKAMQKGLAVRDSSFIDQLFAQTQEKAEEAAKPKDAIAQFEAYRMLASDFSGLKEGAQYQAKLEALKTSPELKQALKKELDAIDQQRRLTDQLSSELSQAADASLEEQQTLRTAILGGMSNLKDKADHAKNEESRLVFGRAFNQLWVQGVEAGQAELENKKRFAKAAFYFELIGTISPSEPWPILLLAEADAARGDRKRACKNLREAIKRGLKNPETLEKDMNLQSLRAEPEFQQMVADLKAKAGSPAH
jgi:dienelactone hydrolase